jgi:hypothetical protein
MSKIFDSLHPNPTSSIDYRIIIIKYLINNFKYFLFIFFINLN